MLFWAPPNTRKAPSEHQMASIKKEGKSWRAQVTVSGQKKVKRFVNKAEAQDWAAKTEVEMRSLKGGVSLTHTAKDVFERYAREVSPNKRGERWELLRLNSFCEDELAGIKLIDLKSDHIGKWRDRRLKTVSGSTVNRELNLMSNCFNVASKEWGWMNGSPTRDIRRPEEAAHRERLVSEEEAETLCFCLGFDGQNLDSIGARVGACFMFAIETGMRAGEIAGLGPGSVQGRVARLEMTKNGTGRDVPLSSKALAIWELTSGAGFGVTSRQIDANFRKAKKKAAIDDIVFHDSRHTFITKTAHKLDILALARVTGHKDLKMLQRYYNKPAEEIAKQLD